MLKGMMISAFERHEAYYRTLDPKYQKCILDILTDINTAMDECDEPWLKVEMKGIIYSDKYNFGETEIYLVIERYVMQTYRINGYRVVSGEMQYNKHTHVISW